MKFQASLKSRTGLTPLSIRISEKDMVLLLTQSFSDPIVVLDYLKSTGKLETNEYIYTVKKDDTNG